ncbi:fasciclin domain-containing protein [Rubritalea tangerina]|uniref:Fasciclin domain-containing protein n=1 Tax=Rubritalea tangerina TaxID=430798 RepID=A0ABW4Z8W6_9BACT
MKKIVTAVGASICLCVQPVIADNHKSKPGIVEIAAGNSDFETLVAAVKAAGLVEALSGDGPFTVFAPTDAAFEKLPAGTLETLLKPENKGKLADILKYHVVAGKVMAKDVKPGEVKTLQGGSFEVRTEGGNVMVGKAKVIKTDIVGKNGVIHVIDTVILPPEGE